MRPSLLLVLLLAAALSACPRARMQVPEEPPAVRVQLAVPPNAPGEDQFLEVGLFRVALSDPALGRGPSGETLLRVSLALEPPETRVYRLDPAGLVELTGAAPATEAFVVREDPIVSEAGISDPHARWVASPPGRLVALGSPGADGAPGRLEVVREGPSGPKRPAAPALAARGVCTPTPLAVTQTPLRVAWLDCVGEEGAPLLDRLRVSSLEGETWTTTTAPVDLLALGASPDGAEPHLEARFAGDELLALVARRGDGAGAIVGVANGAWRLRASLPELRVGRAGPPVLVRQGADVLAAWHEPSLDGAQVLLRQGLRERWPLFGRGGVDTRLPGALGLVPAVGWDDGQPLVAVAEPGGLYVLRWNGDDWRRWGGRIQDATGVTDVALAERGGQALVAWTVGGQLFTAERTAAGWQRSAAPLASGARAMRLAGAAKLSALAWLDAAGTVRARTRGRRGDWRGEIALDAAAGAQALDVAVGARRALVAVQAPRAGGLRVFQVAGDARDLGAPAEAREATVFAVAAQGDGQAVVGWVGAAGVSLALRADDGGWRMVACPGAAGLGPSVDALDVAATGDGAAWIAARQSRPARHVRVVRCAIP